MNTIGEREDETAEQLIPIDINGSRIYVAAHRIDGRNDAEEQEITARGPKLEQVIEGLAILAEAVAERMKETQATKVGVEFGCEVAVESGQLVAIIGKASTRSTFSVSLEWTKP